MNSVIDIDSHRKTPRDDVNVNDDYVADTMTTEPLTFKSRFFSSSTGPSKTMKFSSDTEERNHN